MLFSATRSLLLAMTVVNTAYALLPAQAYDANIERLAKRGRLVARQSPVPTPMRVVALTCTDPAGQQGAGGCPATCYCDGNTDGTGPGYCDTAVACGTNCVTTNDCPYDQVCIGVDGCPDSRTCAAPCTA